jgi:hypothetical protein
MKLKNATYVLLGLVIISCKKEASVSSGVNNNNVDTTLTNNIDKTTYTNLAKNGSTTVEISGLNNTGLKVNDTYKLEYSTAEENIYYSESESASGTIQNILKFEIRQRQQSPNINFLKFDILYSQLTGQGNMSNVGFQYFKSNQDFVVIDSNSNTISNISNIVFNKTNGNLFADYVISAVKPAVNIKGKINVTVKEKK